MVSSKGPWIEYDQNCTVGDSGISANVVAWWHLWFTPLVHMSVKPWRVTCRIIDQLPCTTAMYKDILCFIQSIFSIVKHIGTMLNAWDYDCAPEINLTNWLLCLLDSLLFNILVSVRCCYIFITYIKMWMKPRETHPDKWTLAIPICMDLGNLTLSKKKWASPIWVVFSEENIPAVVIKSTPDWKDILWQTLHSWLCILSRAKCCQTSEHFLFVYASQHNIVTSSEADRDDPSKEFFNSTKKESFTSITSPCVRSRLTNRSLRSMLAKIITVVRQAAII